MRKIIQKHKNYWSQSSLLFSTIWGVILLCLSFWFSNVANNYANKVADKPVADLILSNIPVFNVNFIVVYGGIGLLIFIFLLLLFEPQKIPFTLKSVSLFIAIRALFMILTHIAQFTPQALLDSGPIIDLVGGGNQGGLFFSGHTGLPFLMALINWNNKKLRFIFLGSATILGISLLLGHLHYSIDIFGAFLVTYSIFHIAEKLFAKDRLVFNQGVHH